ncbi:hypothetical protein KCP75_11500 [Salmonella enterica subsp. enterica]|nr:hypothetical protein KCP75_11500 [Salmonella enterica subsp. enterica]
MDAQINRVLNAPEAGKFDNTVAIITAGRGIVDAGRKSLRLVASSAKYRW